MVVVVVVLLLLLLLLLVMVVVSCFRLRPGRKVRRRSRGVRVV